MKLTELCHGQGHNRKPFDLEGSVVGEFPKKLLPSRNQKSLFSFLGHAASLRRYFGVGALLIHLQKQIQGPLVLGLMNKNIHQEG